MNAQFLDLPITSVCEAARADVRRFAEELLSHGQGTGVIHKAAAADPECALAQGYGGALFLTLMTREGRIQAAPRIALAQRLAVGATLRERMTIAAIAAWADNDMDRAIRLLRDIVENWPQDIVAAKFAQILELQMGDRRGMTRTAAMAAACPDRSGYALALYGFALEQSGLAEAGLRFARRAENLNPGRDPWAQHAIAHALVAMDQPVEARAMLRAAAPDWDRCSSFMLTHNWWHLALLDIGLGQPDAALAGYDTRIWGVRKGHVQDQINAISLLARLEMNGVAVGDRWDDVAAHVADLAQDRLCSFVDLHLLYALARAGRDDAANQLVSALADDPVAGPAAQALVAHARQDHCTAVIAMAPVRASIPSLGGSNVQQALFDEIFRDAVRCMNADAPAGRDRRIAA